MDRFLSFFYHTRLGTCGPRDKTPLNGWARVGHSRQAHIHPGFRIKVRIFRIKVRIFRKYKVFTKYRVFMTEIKGLRVGEDKELNRMR